MRIVAVLVSSLALATLGAGAARAAGCLKGAVVGGVAGHFAGRHPILGAGAGCLVGRHISNRNEKRAQQGRGYYDNHHRYHAYR